MITTYKETYRNGELRIGWASWDKGQYKERSIKFAYRDTSGKISRGSPELPFDVLIDMLVLAAEQNELDQAIPKPRAQKLADINTLSFADLKTERASLSITLTQLQKMVSDHPWANWHPIYDQIGKRLETVKTKITEHQEK
jgi:hypothetical protein